MAELKELLDNAKAFDMAQQANMVKIGKAILSIPPQVAAPLPKVHELDLSPETADPFGGNLNNRHVAERIAVQNKRIYANAHPVIHTGDPDKASRDVELSKRLNPDSLTDNELDEQSKNEFVASLAKNPPKSPSPGSPAATKAEPTATGAPAPWKPNAGPMSK